MLTRSTVIANATRVDGSVVACSLLARFLRLHLNCEVADSADASLRHQKYDNLILINSLWGFCTEEHRARVRDLLWKARRVIWAQQEIDGGIGPRSFKSMGAWLDGLGSANVRAGPDGRRRLDLWTNIPLFVERGYVSRSIYVSARSTYVNWNALHYAPELKPKLLPKASAPPRIFYFGAFRPDRASRFARYLTPELYDVVISTAVGRSVLRFKELLGPDVTIEPRAKSLIERLAFERATVYIEDERTAETYNSPAARFYEALSANVCQFIDHEAVPNLERAGFVIDPAWIVNDARDVARKLRYAATFANSQCTAWATTRIRRQFNSQLKEALSK
jgi:hypothetical protein